MFESQYIKASYINVLLELTSTTTGSLASSGKVKLSTLSLISVNKSLVSTQVSSSTITKELQTLDVEVIFLIHSKSFIAFSTSSVIRESISSGFTHG
ncbi:hypothetical protein ACFLY2_00095 [Patescibacteria group bacterium]